MANWDPASPTKVRDARLALGAILPDSKRISGARDQVDPLRHRIACAMARAGDPEKDAVNINVTLPKSGGTTVYRLPIKDVPVDAFGSISIENERGCFEPNKGTPARSKTSRREERGGLDHAQFGGYGGKSPTACRSCWARSTWCAATALGRMSSPALP